MNFRCILFLFLFCFSINSVIFASEKDEAIFFYQKSSDLIKSGKLTLAESALKTAISKDPSFSMPYFVLGDIYSSDPVLLDYEEAIKCYEAFIKRSDGDTAVYDAFAYKRIGDASIAMEETFINDRETQRTWLLKAEKAYKEALALSFYENEAKNRSLVLIALADISLKLKDTKMASEYLENVDPGISPYLPEYWLADGILNMRLGKYKDAEKSFKSILESDPIIYNKAEICLRQISEINRRNFVFFALLSILSIILLVLSFSFIRRLVSKKKFESFSITGFKESADGVWEYDGQPLDTFKSAANFMAKILCELTGMTHSYVLVPNRDRNRLITLEGVHSGNMKDVELSFAYSEEYAKLWFDRRGSSPFLEKRELKETSYIKAFPDAIYELEKLSVKIGVPIYHNAFFIGMIYLSYEGVDNNLSKLHKKYKANLDIIKMFASRMSSLIYAILEKEAAIIDAETGLYNEFHYESVMNNLINKFSSSDRVFAVVKLHLDQYIKWEKILGEEHAIRMRDMIIDLLNEFSSDLVTLFIMSKVDFSFIMVDYDFSDAYNFALEIQKRISAVKLTYQADSMTASIAIAIWPYLASDGKEFRNLIDESLNSASSVGVNQIITVEPLVTGETLPKADDSGAFKSSSAALVSASEAFSSSKSAKDVAEAKRKKLYDAHKKQERRKKYRK